MKLVLKLIAILGLIALVVFDSRHHFDPELVDLKKKHHSAQRHWSLFFGQDNVYLNGSLKYRESFTKIAALIEPQSIVISDLPTSYYSASYLPVYVRNAHAHHGGRRTWEWSGVIADNILCYLDAPGYQDKFLKAYKNSKISVYGSKGSSVYVLLNTDSDNSVLYKECLWRRAKDIAPALEQIAKPIYTDALFKLYLLGTS